MINNSALEKAVAFAAPIGRYEHCSPSPVCLEVAHNIPGRLRLKATSLKGNNRAIAQAQQELKDITGVKGIMANLYAGSITVEYDPKDLDYGTIAERLSWHGYTIMPGAADSIDTRNTEYLAHTVGRALLCAVVERIAVTMVGAMVGALI